jgi:glyoxylase-like metal-dependent hydrolase (beta-lactamase superfamily II)
MQQATRNKGFSRRGFITNSSLAVMAAWLKPSGMLNFNYEESPVTKIINAAATAKISVQKLRGNISVMEGSGGNISVFTGTEGKLLVDGGIGVSQKNVSAALGTISADPVKYLVNTHWHFDHTFGNEWLHEAGATIVAQEMTRNHLSKVVRVADWDYTFQPFPNRALPSIVFKQDETIHFNGSPVILKKYQPAHTDGDISVHFPDADILHVADTWWNGYYPFIDYSTGGCIKGMIHACEVNLEKTTDKTIIVPGHGPVGNRAQMKEYLDMLQTITKRVSDLKKEGRSEKDVIAAKPTKSYDEKFNRFVIGPDVFTHLVYQGVCRYEEATI